MKHVPTLDLHYVQSQYQLARRYPQSFTTLDGSAVWMERVGEHRTLAILSPPENPLLGTLTGTHRSVEGEHILKLCPVDAQNAATLRHALPWLRPVPLGLTTSAGFGDRLGMATPGHIRALRHVSDRPHSRSVAPIFAQQSIREMERTGRAPLEVLADATWGAFETGWRTPSGADADHLKTTGDIDATVAAGYSTYTLDPGEHVDDTALDAPRDALRRGFDALPWRETETDPADLLRRLTSRPIELEDRAIRIDSEALARAAVKYGRVIAHVLQLYRHLESTAVEFEMEISVDETETPTSHIEHIYIAEELRRLGVRWISLAPRYVGRFEKGVDYIGDLTELRASLDGHAAIARAFGPYKLSLHSGSDKFSVYPSILDATGGMVHLKTAGTSYLEALRVVSRVDPTFFREVLAHARDCYAADRVSYHVSAETSRIPPPIMVADERLPDLLDQFDSRQVLHVTFGSTLAAFRPRLMDLLRAHENAYNEAIEVHFIRHLEPFAGSVAAPARTTER